MELEQQVTSLETSKKLLELKVKQESLFCWVLMEWKEYIVTEEEFRDSNEMDYLYSAFTASELGEILPLFWVQKKWPDYYRSHSKLVWMNDFFIVVIVGIKGCLEGL